MSSATAGPAGQRAPVAFFAFNRPDHAARTLARLAECQGAAETQLVAFLDGPRDERDRAACDQVADAVAAATGFASVEVRRATANQGLYRSITGGVDEVLSKAERVIVVEDDLLVSADFLDYMAFNLATYARETRVACIHGYALPLADLPDAFFLPGGDCWGWATWADRWAVLERDPTVLLGEFQQQSRLAELTQSHGAGALQMLCDRAEGRNQSWAILWHASLVLAGRLTLHPGSSLVENIGNDGTGTHSQKTERYGSGTWAGRWPTRALPVEPDTTVARRYSRFMDKLPEAGLLGALASRYYVARALRRARRILKRLAGNRTRIIGD